MSEPHRIRLREPWVREPPANGGTRYHRAFNAPTGLTPGTTVTIVCDGPLTPSAVVLNGMALRSNSSGENLWSSEITSLLVARNELTLDFAATASPADALPWREVRLEIYAP